MNNDDFYASLLTSVATGTVVPFLTRYHEQTGGCFGRLASAVKNMLEDGEDEMLHRLHAALPDDFALRFITLYGMACLASTAGDAVLTVQALRASVRLGAAAHGMFSTDTNALAIFNAAVQQAYAIDPDALPSAPPPAREVPPAQGAPVVLSSCNGVYFEQYGPAFLASAAALDGLRCHIHVVNPTAATEEIFRAACHGARSELSFGTGSGPDVASYYACKRFLVAGSVMDRFGADVIITDIDTRLTPHLLTLMEHVADADAGLFQRDVRTAPMEICHCSLSFFRRTQAGRHFLALLPAYLEPKLAESGVWMQDQCSLFLISRLWRQQPGHPAWAGLPMLRWLDLTTRLGPVLDKVNPNQVSTLEEKRAMRRYDQMDASTVYVDANGRPHFRHQQDAP